MTRSFLIPALALGLAACATSTDETSDAAADAPATTEATTNASDPATAEPMGDGVALVGEPLAAAEFMDAQAAYEQAEALDGQFVPVEGTITKVCQNKGCWMTLETENGETFRVVVPKDADGEYLYTFPADVAGATAQLEGTLAMDEESVETQRHLAEDEGADAATVDAITEARPAVVFTATGARLSRSS